jgi:hypothetical protein
MRANFIHCAAKVTALASHYGSLGNAPINQEMADEAQKAADAWTALAQTLNAAVAGRVTPASIAFVREAGTSEGGA